MYYTDLFTGVQTFIPKYQTIELTSELLFRSPSDYSQDENTQIIDISPS